MQKSRSKPCVTIRLPCANTDQFLEQFAPKMAGSMFVTDSEPFPAGTEIRLQARFSDGQVRVSGVALVEKLATEETRNGILVRLLRLDHDSLLFPLARPPTGLRAERINAPKLGTSMEHAAISLPDSAKPAQFEVRAEPAPASPPVEGEQPRSGAVPAKGEKNPDTAQMDVPESPSDWTSEEATAPHGKPKIAQINRLLPLPPPAVFDDLDDGVVLDDDVITEENIAVLEKETARLRLPGKARRPSGMELPLAVPVAAGSDTDLDEQAARDESARLREWDEDAVRTTKVRAESIPVADNSVEIEYVFDEESADDVSANDFAITAEKAPPQPDLPRPRRWIAAGALVIAAVAAVALAMGSVSVRPSEAVHNHQRIAADIAAADQRIAEGRLVGAGGDHALDYLLAASKLDPTHPDVIERLHTLADKFEELAGLAVEAGNLAEAAAHLQAVLSADPTRGRAARSLRAIEDRVRGQIRDRARQTSQSSVGDR